LSGVEKAETRINDEKLKQFTEKGNVFYLRVLFIQFKIIKKKLYFNIEADLSAA